MTKDKELLPTTDKFLSGDCEMNDEPLDEYGCMDCIHDDEEDHTESCYRCSWLMGEGKGYTCLFQPKDEPANMARRNIKQWSE